MGLMDYMQSIDWEQESYPNPQDFVVLPFFALLFPSVRLLLDRIVFEQIGKKLIFGEELKDSEVQKRRKLRKFKESAWKFIYYLSAEIFALSVTYNEPWFRKTAYFWEGPGDQVWPDQKMKLKVKALYMYSAGFYSYSILTLIFGPRRRSDFGVSMGHHIVTTTLILLSYLTRFSRVGTVILAIHDASNVLFEFERMSRYGGSPFLAFLSSILYGSSWVVLRLIYYPLWIMWSTCYEVISVLKKHPEGPLYYYVFNNFLICYLVFHFYRGVPTVRRLLRELLYLIELLGQVLSELDEMDED